MPELNKTPLPPFRGMMPILPTAITESGDMDETSERRLVEYCIKCGAVAIGHLGGASEFSKVADDDRRTLIKILVDQVEGRVPVFIGATAPATRAAVSYAKEAEDLGADMLMVGIPYTFPPTAAEVFDYYAAISDAVSLPIMVQDTPNSNAILTVDYIWNMYTQLENIHYVKAEGTGFLTKTKALMERFEGKMGVIGGAGGLSMIHLLRIGVTSFITGTEALDLHASVVHAYLDGDKEVAANIYYNRLLPYLMFYRDHNRELLKEILFRRGIIDCPKVIPPVGKPMMTPVEWQEFDWIMERIGLTNKWPDIP
jgi:2-keto-3-deoxy-L-arabinonate dehydratase